ncbi:MAG: hypothetical protein SNF33_03775 [Candidatus Algichlamydia australiensis]|nr:hypothetical protein [Chlamydiales bacterium]
MRKILPFLLFLAQLPALYNGNPSSPGIMEEGFLLTKEGSVTASLGYRGDYCFDRRMKVTSQFSGDFERFKTSFQQGVFALDFFDRVEVYGSLGTIRIEAMQRPMEGFKNEYETGYRFTWGVGGTILIYQTNQLAIGLDAKYQHGTPDLDWIGVNGFAFGDLSGADIHYSEWQIGLGLSYQIELFIPYIAAKYSNAKAEFSSVPPGLLPATNFDAKSRYPFGFALGTTLTTQRLFSLNVEVRLLDEEAISLAGTLKF